MGVLETVLASLSRRSAQLLVALGAPLLLSHLFDHRRLQELHLCQLHCILEKAAARAERVALLVFLWVGFVRLEDGKLKDMQQQLLAIVRASFPPSAVK